MKAAHSPVRWQALLHLAWPAVTGALLRNAFRPIDQFYVAGLGLEEQGAIGSVTFVMIAMYGCFAVVRAGAEPLISRATGAGEDAVRNRVIGNGLVLCAILTVLLLVLGSMAVGPVISLLGLTGETAVHGHAYLQVIVLTGVAMVFAPTVDASFVAMGDTKTPMKLQIVTLLLNTVLTPIFIFVFHMGTAGAALGSTLGAAVPVSVGVWLLVRRVGLTRADLTLSRSKDIIRLGVPISINIINFALVYWALLATSISPLGPSVNAGLAVGFGALEAVTWPLFMGVSIAAGSEVGRRLGAGDVAGAKLAVRILAYPAVALGLLAGCFFYFGAPHIVGFFSADEIVRQEAILYASVLAFSQPFVAVEALSEGVLAGSGRTKSVFWASVPVNILRIPIAWYLAFPMGLGALGVWWGINITSYIKATIKVTMVLRGRWASTGLLEIERRSG